jgi:hypothetical protein
VTVIADPAECSVQFNPVGTSKFTSSCDIAKSALVKAGVPYSNQAGPAGSKAEIDVGSTRIAAYDATAADAATVAPVFTKSLGDALKTAGYPASADPTQINHFMVWLILFVLVLYVTMVYGPIAAMLVELFPTRIRYTSMSLPYHIGNGWFGGFLPAIAVTIVVSTGNIYSGLWYPIIIAGMTLVIGTLFLKDTRHIDIQKNH